MRRAAAFARSSSSCRSPCTSTGSTTSARTSTRARRSSPCSATPSPSGSRTTTSSWSSCIRRIASACSPPTSARMRRGEPLFIEYRLRSARRSLRLGAGRGPRRRRRRRVPSCRATSSTSLPGARPRSSSATRPSTTRSPGSRIARSSRTASSTRSSCAASRRAPRSPSSSSTSTTSRASTTRSVTRPATRSCAASGIRLREALSPSYTVARLGGDEFAVLIEEVAGTLDRRRRRRADRRLAADAVRRSRAARSS